MKFIFTFVLSILFYASATVAAQKELFVFGGGSEPPGTTTIFDSMITGLNQFVSSSGYQVTSAFDGSHATTQSLNKSLAGNRATVGTGAEINKQIAAYKRQITNGKLKSGDQLLVMVATHGGPVEPPYLNHPVSTADGTMNMHDLLELRDLAEKKGVKLGIIDVSCYSGATLSLGTDKTCVITAANSNVGYINAGRTMVDNMKPGRSLEDVFLSARIGPKSVSPGAPQISSPAGRKVYASTNFLVGAQYEGTTLDDVLKNGNINMCSTVSKEWMELSSDINKAMLASVANPVEDIQVLKAKNLLRTRIDEYNSVRAEAARAHKQMNNPAKACLKLLDNKPEICASYEIYERNYEASKARWSVGKLTPAEQKQKSMIINLRQSSGYQAWLKSMEKYERLRNDIYYKAALVNAQERVVYDYLYDRFSKTEKGPNPCKDFVL